MDITDYPAPSRDATILELRTFSRKLVRELGFMRTTLADSDLAPSAVHAVLEIGAAPGISAKALGEILRLDKSNTSRQAARLEAKGLLERRPAANGDARSSELYLTDAGQKLRRRIDRYATDQVSHALRRMAPADQQALVRSMALYADALARDNRARSAPAGKGEPAIEENGAAATPAVSASPAMPATPATPVSPISHGSPATPGSSASLAPPSSSLSAGAISEGYQPGCIGDIAGLHGRYYAEHWNFGAYFEKRVATELAAFADALPADGKALWLYTENGRVLASLAMDGDPQTGVAHLRWFIVGDALRGAGIGRQLMARAMRFVDARFDETYLWTFKGLDAARHLYESHGFHLTEEAQGTHWGVPVVEQRFSRRHPARK